MISIKDLSKRYDSGFEALKNINLDIRAGEIFALLGPNGAGKTTLIGIVCGIVNPSAGRVTIDGREAAVKVLRPGIKPVIENDIALLNGARQPR
jgi:ABC-type multidrug transport system ATPase subunit